MNHQDIAKRFAYHPPSTDEVRWAHEKIRERCAELAFWFERILPECDEKDEAIRGVDEVCMFANACVARTQLKRTPPPAKSEKIT